MRKLLLITALLSSPAMADTSFCEEYYNTAKSIMQARQNGLPLAEVYSIYRNSAFGKKVVLRAYTEPRFSNPEARKKEAEEFASYHFLGCLKALGDDV